MLEKTAKAWFLTRRKSRTTPRNHQRAAAVPASRLLNSRRWNQFKQLHDPLCTADFTGLQRYAISFLFGQEAHQVHNAVFRDDLDPRTGRVRACQKL